MNIEEFCTAGRELRYCELVDAFDRVRTIEPYMIYVSEHGKRYARFYQIHGYSRSGFPQGWKDEELITFAGIQALDEHFEIRPDYNPFDKKLFQTVEFSIPTFDGRQRE
jgi:hypothetical protein